MSVSFQAESTPAKAQPALRILLIGLPGAGKSTLAEALTRRYALPRFEIDEFRRQYADGTVAGDYLARTHFLRACGKEPRAIFEFSAVGVYRFDTATALREYPAPLLTLWVDAPKDLREERLAQRGGRLPWPRHNPEATPEEIEARGHAVLRQDLAAGFWTKGPGWRAHRLDAGGPLAAATQALFRLVDDFVVGTAGSS